MDLQDVRLEICITMLVICEGEKNFIARCIFLSFSVVCEMCGTSGSSSTFYSKTKRFCSTSCSRSFSSNSKKSSILARLQVRIQQTVCYQCYFVICEASFTGLKKSFNHKFQKKSNLISSWTKAAVTVTVLSVKDIFLSWWIIQTVWPSAIFSALCHNFSAVVEAFYHLCQVNCPSDSKAEL